MIFSTFYFSGTGNTGWAVREFSRILEQKGHQANIYSIEEKALWESARLSEIITASDYTGFANPIYGANIPPIMRSFIKKSIDTVLRSNMPPRQIYMLNTFGYVNAFGPIAARKLFSGTGAELAGYINIMLCNNVSTPKYKIKPLAPHKLEQRKSEALEVLEKAAQSLAAKRKYIFGIGPYLIPGIMIRKKSEKGIRESYLSLGVSPEACRQCLLCVKQCPTHSISFSEGSFAFLDTCTACMRCYNFCPAAAITLDGVYADPREYVRFRGLV